MNRLNVQVSLGAAVAGVGVAALLTGCGGAAGLTTVASSGASQSNAGRLPSDWQRRAVDAADAALRTCSRSAALIPDNCPQASDLNPGGTASWTLLDQHLLDPVALAMPSAGRSTASGAEQVEVYGRYQMYSTYVASGSTIRPWTRYSGGLAHATMSWDGSSFQNVAFTQMGTGNYAFPPSGVTVHPFTRPAGATDSAALAAVAQGFQTCVTLPAPATGPSVPNCPEDGVDTDMAATSGQWRIDRDPLEGALVSFDPETGDVEVHGSFAMEFDYQTPAEGLDQQTSWSSPLNGNYTAVLVWTGSALKLLDIAHVS